VYSGTLENFQSTHIGLGRAVIVAVAQRSCYDMPMMVRSQFLLLLSLLRLLLYMLVATSCCVTHPTARYRTTRGRYTTVSIRRSYNKQGVCNIGL